jgi:hypothetical protein
MVKILERELERHFSKECKKHGVDSLKIVPRYQVGWPDRVVILADQRVVWIELKTETGVLSARQVAVHKMLRDQGHYVFILRTKKDITNVIMDAARISTKGC